MFNGNLNDKLVSMETQLKLLREDNDKLRASIQTLTKHVKFLVYSVKLVNPDLAMPEESN